MGGSMPLSGVGGRGMPDRQFGNGANGMTIQHPDGSTQHYGLGERAPYGGGYGNGTVAPQQSPLNQVAGGFNGGFSAPQTPVGPQPWQPAPQLPPGAAGVPSGAAPTHPGPFTPVAPPNRPRPRTGGTPQAPPNRGVR